MSRFVSSGAIDPASGAHVEDAEGQPPAAAPAAGKGTAEGGGKNREAWEAVQREVEEERKRRAAEKASVEPGKSLYDVLQENKGISPPWPTRPAQSDIIFALAGPCC